MSLSDRERKIEEAIREGSVRQRDALAAGLRPLAVLVQKQILVLQEDLKNEREHLEALAQRQHSLELAAAQSSAFVAPPSSRSSGRNSAKQDSFRMKLLRRNAFFNRSGRCDICDENCVGSLEATRVFELAKRSELEAEYLKAPADSLPTSVNDAGNGLLLCPNCHAYFDKPVRRGSKKRNIEITANGTIRLHGDAKKMINYLNLEGKKVPWHDKIGTSGQFPTPYLLTLCLKFSVSPGKRLHELSDPESAEEPGDEKQVKKKARRN